MLLLQDEKAVVVFTVMGLGVSILCHCVCLQCGGTTRSGQACRSERQIAADVRCVREKRSSAVHDFGMLEP